MKEYKVSIRISHTDVVFVDAVSVDHPQIIYSECFMRDCPAWLFERRLRKTSHEVRRKMHTMGWSEIKVFDDD